MRVRYGLWGGPRVKVGTVEFESEIRSLGWSEGKLYSWLSRMRDVDENDEDTV